MSGEEAIALNDIALEMADDSKGSNIYVDDITGTDESWKDERIKKLEEQIEHKDNLLGFFKKETKTKVFDNRKLRKALKNADELLDNICDQITDDYKAKDDVINSLLREAKEKDTLVKELNKVITTKDWSRINDFEENKKELDYLQEMIQNKDDLISQQLARIITEDTKMEEQNARIDVLQQKVFKHIGEKFAMETERQENSLKLKQLEKQIQQLQNHNHALEDDIIQIENAKKKKKCWLWRFFRNSSPQNSNDKSKSNNKKSSKRTSVKGYFSRRFSSQQTQTTLDNNEDVVGETSQWNGQTS